VCALPIAIIAVCGLRIVGTKYLPPILPTLETLNVASAKSSAVNFPFAALSERDLSSLSIYKMLLF
jgi:hypothetical protein